MTIRGFPLLVGLIVLLCMLPGVPVAAQYPEIRALSPADHLYRQMQDDIQRFYRQSRSGGTLPALVIYEFDPAEFDSLIALSARFTLPYSTIASLNRIQNPELSGSHSPLLVPNMPGLFVPTDPANELERLMAELRSDDKAAHRITATVDGEPVTFRFFPGEDFDRVERLAFLNILFRRPIRNVRISSGFGWRESPVTGVRSFHAGVDFAAPPGSDVLASRDGTVVDVGTDGWYGKYVIVEHTGGYSTFYAHMDAALVELNQGVTSGTIIGRVGSTGRSTGPHLHFEIRMDGIPQDPVRHLPGLKR